MFESESALKQSVSFSAWQDSGDGMSSGGCKCACLQIACFNVKEAMKT